MLFAVSITIIINSMLITILIHLKYQLDFIGDCMKVVINNVNDDSSNLSTCNRAATIELNKVGFMMKILIDLHVEVSL